MVSDSEIKKMIQRFRFRYKLAKEKDDEPIAGIYAGVINELQKLIEGG